MSTFLQPQTKTASKPAFTPVPSGLLQRKCTCGGSAGLDGECEECRKTRLQRRAVNGTEISTVPPIVHEVLRSPGQPLDLNMRAFMEPRFGHELSRISNADNLENQIEAALETRHSTPTLPQDDAARELISDGSVGESLSPDARTEMETHFGFDFSRIRIHSNSQNAAALRAKAFTSGQHIWFSPGHGPSDSSLLAHEITHVVQQSRGEARGLDGAGGNETQRAALESRARLQSERSDTGMHVASWPLRSLPHHPPAPIVLQFSFEEDVLRELQQRIDESDSEAIAARRERLRQIFQSVEPSEARRHYESLTAEGRARDALARLFQRETAQATRDELLAILQSKFRRLARAEREWYEEHPDPRVSRRGRTLILWNFPIDSAEIQPAHGQAIRRFLEDQGITWIHGGTYLEINGRASESGLPEYNLDLSRQRADAVRDAASRTGISERVEIRTTGLGIRQPLASNDSPVGMARNRSVEIVVVVPGPTPVPDRDQKWRYAQQYLESRVGAVVGGGPDLMWTPTATGFLRMIPRIPLFEDNLPDHYGANEPTEPFCSDRPASSCVPRPYFETREILGEKLESEFRLNMDLSERRIREVVDLFILEAERAFDRRTDRLAELEFKISQGGGAMIQPNYDRYRGAERHYFFSDPTCLIRYIRQP